MLNKIVCGHYIRSWIIFILKTVAEKVFSHLEISKTDTNIGGRRWYNNKKKQKKHTVMNKGVPNEVEL